MPRASGAPVVSLAQGVVLTALTAAAALALHVVAIDGIGFPDGHRTEYERWALPYLRTALAGLLVLAVTFGLFRVWSGLQNGASVQVYHSTSARFRCAARSPRRRHVPPIAHGNRGPESAGPVQGSEAAERQRGHPGGGRALWDAGSGMGLTA